MLVFSVKLGARVKPLYDNFSVVIVSHIDMTNLACAQAKKCKYLIVYCVSFVLSTQKYYFTLFLFLLSIENGYFLTHELTLVLVILC